MNGEVIYGYSRKEAIADGVLIDVSQTAREAGIRFPVALTVGAWQEFVAVPPNKVGQQDEAGRLWDVLWMLRHAARQGGSVLRYSVLVVTAKGRRRKELKAVCGPGDTLEPVITIMLPEED